MQPTALVIGGTGPSGPYVFGGLLARGHRVTMCHTGEHEIREIPPEVEHLHTDPFDRDKFTAGLGDRSFDIVIATYGRSPLARTHRRAPRTHRRAPRTTVEARLEDPFDYAAEDELVAQWRRPEIPRTV